jgi:hypothetical protein
MLVLANKVDCAKIERIELVKSLNLDYITDNPWTVLAVSAKHGDGTTTTGLHASPAYRGRLCWVRELKRVCVCAYIRFLVPSTPIPPHLSPVQHA